MKEAHGGEGDAIQITNGEKKILMGLQGKTEGFHQMSPED